MQAENKGFLPDGKFDENPEYKPWEVADVAFGKA
jgi:hypothetical protein